MMVIIKKSSFGHYFTGKDGVKNSQYYFVNISLNIKHYLKKYVNIIIIDNFNIQTDEGIMENFCEMYNLENLVK